MDILSATNYPVPCALPTKRKVPKARQKPDKVPTLGYVRDQSSDDGEPAPKRLRKQLKSDEEDSAKKHRGRPRLETQDETAVERRRTQIRLAQRAYRLRKETTISALKKRIVQLENTIEQMNKSFVLFNDNAMDSGALKGNPDLVQQLRATTKQFLQLARTVSSDSDIEEDAIEEITQEKDLENTDDSIPGNLRQQSSGPPGVEQQSEMEIMPSVERLDSLDLFSSTVAALRYTDTPDLLKYQQWNLEIPEAPTSSQEEIAIERPLNQPSSLYTYNFQETTFARRLHRATLERAFRLLTSPSTDPDEISHAFRFTFCFSNRRRMVSRFQDLLKRTAGESLENWNIPFFYVGGAGTHYPRIGRDGTYNYPPNIHSPAKAFGPMCLPGPETPRQEQTVEQLLQAIGFGGKWFDSYDVESYLQEKGIYLSAQSSFVDIDASMLSPPSSLTSDSFSHKAPSTSPSHGSRSPWPATQLEGTPHILLDSFDDRLPEHTQTLHLEKPLDGFPIWSSEAPINSSIDAWEQQVSQVSEGLITLDVDKFLNEVTSKSVCLGRAPGFRQSDVDNALRLAVQEIY